MTSRTQRDRRRRRRPGRFRRWVVRPAVWAVVAVGLLFCAIYLYLDSARFAERLKQEAETRLEAILERDVRIESLELELMPLGVEIGGFEIAAAEPGREPTFALDRVRLEARVGSLLRPGIYLDELVLERPRFRMTYDEQGRHDLPRLRRRGGKRAGAPPIDIEIGQVQVIDGEIDLAHRRIPLGLTATNFQAHFSGTGEELELRGSAAADAVQLVLRGSTPYVGRVEVDGLLRSHRFDVERLELRAPDLEARGEGFVRWRGDREARLDIEAAGDLRLFERLGYLEGQAAGGFDFSGSLIRKPGVLLFEGDAVSPRARLFGRDLRDLEARVEGDRNTIRIEAERARYGDGSLSGTVRLGLAVDSGRVDLELDLDRVPLERLLADQQIPIDGVGGAVSGAFNYQFQASDARAGNGWADLVISDEIAPNPEDLPFAGTAPLVIGDGVIRSAALRLASEAQQLTATGFYDLRSSSGSYDFELTSQRIEEIAALLPATAEPGPGAAWKPTAGRGRLAGTLTLDRSRTSIATRVDLEQLTAPGYRADRMLGTVAVDGTGVRDLRLDLTRPEGALIVSGTLPFAEPEPGAGAGLEPPPLALALDAAGWPLDEADVWLPFELPVSGRYSGALELGGELASPAGRLDGRLAPVRFRDLEFESLELDLEFDAERTAVTSATLALSGGSLDLAGELDRVEGGLSFGIGSSPLDLRQGQIAEALGVDLAGRLEIAGEVGGTLERPDVEARLMWSDVAIGGVALPVDERPAIELSWSDSDLVARGSLLGLVDFEGGGRASTHGVELDFELARGRLDRMVKLVSQELLREVVGSFAGRLTVTGSAADEEGSLTPADLTARMTLDRLLTERGQLKLANLEPVEIELTDRELRIRSLFLGDERSEGDLFVGGIVELGEPGTIDLNVQASLATDWLEPLLRSQWPSARLGEGEFSVIGTMSGEPTDPRFNGVGDISAGRITAAELPTSLDRISATLLFYPGLVVLEDSQATLAGGTLRAGGSIDLKGSGPDFPYRFQLRGERMSYRFPQGFLVRGDTDVSLTSVADGRQLTGTARLDRAYYLDDVKVGLEQLLATVFSRDRLEAGATDELRSTTQLDLRVEGEKSLRIRNNLADLRGDVDLLLRGTLARPVVFGTLEAEPGGSLVYNGTEYEVDVGTLTFNNPRRIEPVIDVLARSRLREYEITLGLSGTFDRLAIDLASNPPLADLEVLALMTGSRAGAKSSAALDGTGAGAGDTTGAESFLYGQATSLVAQRFNRLFGLDEFRIDPLTSSTGSLSSARVTVGKQLSRDLAATYSFDPSDTEDEILELEWSVNRSLVLVLTQNGDGTYALDARWEKAF